MTLRPASSRLVSVARSDVASGSSVRGDGPMTARLSTAVRSFLPRSAISLHWFRRIGRGRSIVAADIVPPSVPRPPRAAGTSSEGSARAMNNSEGSASAPKRFLAGALSLLLAVFDHLSRGGRVPAECHYLGAALWPDGNPSLEGASGPVVPA